MTVEVNKVVCLNGRLLTFIFVSLLCVRIPAKGDHGFAFALMHPNTVQKLEKIFHFHARFYNLFGFDFFIALGSSFAVILAGYGFNFGQVERGEALHTFVISCGIERVFG